MIFGWLEGGLRVGFVVGGWNGIVVMNVVVRWRAGFDECAVSIRDNHRRINRNAVEGCWKFIIVFVCGRERETRKRRRGVVHNVVIQLVRLGGSCFTLGWWNGVALSFVGVCFRRGYELLVGDVSRLDGFSFLE